jgi:hypothetical protein
VVRAEVALDEAAQAEEVRERAWLRLLQYRTPQTRQE